MCFVFRFFSLLYNFAFKKYRIKGFISFIFFIPLCSPVLSLSPPLLFFTPLHHPSFPLHPGGGSEPPLKLTCWKPRSLGLSAAAPPLTSVCVLPYAAVDSLQVFWSHKETSRTHGSLRWHYGTRCGTLPNTMASYNGRGFHTAAESL